MLSVIKKTNRDRKRFKVKPTPPGDRTGRVLNLFPFSRKVEMKLCDCGCGQPAPIAKRNNYRYGFLKGQGKRFIPGHGNRGKKRPGMGLGKKHTEETKQKMKLSKWGSNNPIWKGDLVGYEAVHGWVKRHKPKPELCERCKVTTPYDLSNISGQYLRDVTDYEWICRRCHMQKDGRIEEMKKHLPKGWDMSKRKRNPKNGRFVPLDR